MCSHSATVRQPLPVTTIMKGKACGAKKRNKGEKEEERGERADEGEKEGRKEVGEEKKEGVN